MARYRVKPECGTLSGYDWHTRDEKAEPCVDCREAMKLHWKNKRKERNKEINDLRRKWRMDEQYHRSMNNKRLHHTAKQEPYTYRDVLDTYGNDCHLCNTPVDLRAPRRCGEPGWELGLQVDHIIPLSKGGDDTLHNVRPSHGYCNNKKSATLPMQI